MKCIFLEAEHSPPRADLGKADNFLYTASKFWVPQPKILRQDDYTLPRAFLQVSKDIVNHGEWGKAVEQATPS